MGGGMTMVSWRHPRHDGRATHGTVPDRGCSMVCAVVLPSVFWAQKSTRTYGMNSPNNITHALHCGLLLAVFLVLSGLLYWVLRL